jgi:hypothetical protein
MSNESVISASSDYILEKYLSHILELEKENARLRVELALSQCESAHYERLLNIYEKPRKSVKKSFGGAHV